MDVGEDVLVGVKEGMGECKEEGVVGVKEEGVVGVKEEWGGTREAP